MVRATPGLMVLRPADANEVVEAWKVAMQLQHEPALLVLTAKRFHNRPDEICARAASLARLRLADATGGKPDVAPARHGASYLCVERSSGFRKRNPSTRRQACRPGTVRNQDQAYRIPPAARGEGRVCRDGHNISDASRYVGVSGHSIGMRSFGSLRALKDLQSILALP